MACIQGEGKLLTEQQRDALPITSREVQILVVPENRLIKSAAVECSVMATMDTQVKRYPLAHLYIKKKKKKTKERRKPLWEHKKKRTDTLMPH